jgi:hypothetical protein
MRKISDKEAIEHFKKTTTLKMSLNKKSNKKKEKPMVISGEKKYPVKDILKHMEAGDEIGKREIEIEKNYMRHKKER